ncbi:MAG: ATP synthase F1 subunit gamma [Candidatus Kapabacteria bacterium]|nr:ATP synthase F1 subunit gamma [Candidatus Kapabacteria bacterium]
MATLRDIRFRIKSVKNTSKITSAMKMVSASKLRRAQEAVESARPYVKKMEEVIANLVSAAGEDYTNPIIENRKEVANVAIIVITSDRGLCGSFNTNIIKAVTAYINNDLKIESPDANISIVTVGKKATSVFNKSNYPVLEYFVGIFAALKFEHAVDIIDSVKDLYLNRKLDKVVIFSNEFVNIVKQVPTMRQLLPLAKNVQSNEKSTSFSTDYIYEPNQKEILDVLLPKLLNISVWRCLLSSSAAEHAARMFSMDNATRNAKELIDSLNLIYNSKRQAAITTEMLEIVGGAEALSKA